MRIDQIDIENFRCFKGLNQFNIDGKTIILYGENGYGKSSFFDAIEWCLTGTVDRFKQPGERNINKKIISNRQAKEGEYCSVELTIEGIKLKRSFRIIEGARETILVKDLSDITITQGKENVERYIEENIAYENANKKLLTTLIKKSHILSQDQITDFVLRDDPKDRFDSLADIMGYRQLMNLTKNLKKVKTEINRNITQQNQSILTYKNVIESKLEEKVELDLLEINQLLEQLKINVNQEDILSEIKKKEESLVDSKGRLDEKISNFHNLDYDLTKISYNNLEINSNQLENQIEKNDNNLKRIERLLDKIYEENNHISKQLANIDSQSNILNERINLEKNISDIEFELNDFNVSEDNLEHLIKEAEKKQEELFYVQTHHQSYLSSQEIIKNNPILISKNKLQIGKYGRRISKYSKYLGNFQSLLDNENESTSLNSLNNAIQEVYSYVNSNKHHVNNDICPVCSSEKEDLSRAILNNIESNLFIIQQNSSRISKINDIIKYTNQKVTKLKSAKISAENELKNLETNLIISEENLKGIQNSNLYENDSFELEYDKITDLLKAISERINKYNNFKVKYYTLKSLRDKLNNYPQKELTNNENWKTVLKIRRLNLSNRKANLNRLQEKEKDIKKSTEDEYKKVNQILFLLSRILPNDKRNLAIEVVFDEMKKEINEINLQIELTRRAINSYQKLLDNSKIESNIQQYTNIVLQNEEKLEDSKRELEIIDNYRNAIFDQIGDKAADLLNRPDSKIQKYFRYLNPVPDVNEVLFNSPSPEELEIVLSYKNKSGMPTNVSNVQHSLSSGQLYVLAISIFLAINEEQNVSKLDFVGIDDPIQNMDDVNQFSICDVLSSINRQLIFSTHDLDFMKLYLKKNEHVKDSIQVFMLENNDSLVTNIKSIKFND